MGFIEDLRRGMAAKSEAQRIAKQLDDQNEDRERTVSLERAKEKKDQWKREKKTREEIWRRSKAHFEQTGIMGMLNELVGIRAAVSIDRFNESKMDDFCVQLNINIIKENAKSKIKSEYWFRFIRIAASVDGTITFEGKDKISVPKVDWERDKSILEQNLGKVYERPFCWEPKPLTYDSDDRGFCLPGNSSIKTPDGAMLVKDLKIGNLVWTADKSGNRVQAVIIQKKRRLVSKSHRMVHTILKDGRKLIVSPGHPTVDNKRIGNLIKGQILDKSQIVSIKIMPYKEKYTYDILPSGETGGYWVNNILIGSTLSNQFKENFGACFFVYN